MLNIETLLSSSLKLLHRHSEPHSVDMADSHSENPESQCHVNEKCCLPDKTRLDRYGHGPKRRVQGGKTRRSMTERVKSAGEI